MAGGSGAGMNSIPAIPMLARQNDDGVSVNESAVCIRCAHDGAALESSRSNWADADDVAKPDTADDALYPIDNPDGVCNGCGAEALFPAP